MLVRFFGGGDSYDKQLSAKWEEEANMVDRISSAFLWTSGNTSSREAFFDNAGTPLPFDVAMIADIVLSASLTSRSWRLERFNENFFLHHSMFVE